MEILKEGIGIYASEPFGIIVCPDCCSNIGNSCIGPTCKILSIGNA